MKQKVLVIGLDGGEPSLIFKWAKEGKLPNIAKLMKSGVYGKLRSTIPPLTAPAWVSFMTGKNPGKHGIIHFLMPEERSYERRLMSLKDIKGETLWDLLNKRNRRIGLVNLPLTYPPKEINGFMVSGYTTPGEECKFTYPPELKKKLLDKFNYRIETDRKFSQMHWKEKGKEFIEDEYEVTKTQFEASLYLMKNYEWDIFMVVFRGPDELQHSFWSEKEVIEEYHRYVDEIVGELVNASGKETTIIIMSDHGFGGLDKDLYLNNWLMRKGLLKLKKSKRDIRYLLRKCGLTKGIIRKILRKTRLLKAVKSKIPNNLKRKIPERELQQDLDIDWSKTKAFSFTGGQLYINLKGRQPKGTVKERKYKRLRECIIKELSQLKDPETGEKVIEKVYKREEIYPDAHQNNLPDLVVLVKEGYRAVVFGPEFQIIGKTNRTGDHRLDGIFIASGPEIKKNEIISNAEIIDIAPTILYMFGIPIPRDMDGRVLKEIFKEDSELAKKKIIYDSESERIREKIKKLRLMRRI